jgi:cytochrome c
MNAAMQWAGIFVLAAALGSPARASAAVDEADAKALLKASKCLTCHSVDKKKDGPAYKEVASEYRDDPEAQQKIVDWLSSEHDIEIDGEEDTHPMAKTKDVARIGNLAAWVLSR